MENWSAGQYLKFEEQRTRPASDLLARVPLGLRRRVVDLGCGPGNSTALLADRFPGATIVGVDTSDDMLAEARTRLPGVSFENADVSHWRGNEPLDLIFANAVLQWVPGHIDLMVRLMAQLAPGGCLAVQAPDNFNEPSHVLMRAIAERPAFRKTLEEVGSSRETLGSFADYYTALAPLCAGLDVWRTTYVHALSGPEAIVEWVKGTGLRPFLAPLKADEKTAFLAQYRDEIANAYPPLADGRVLLPFPRLFIVAVRGPAASGH